MSHLKHILVFFILAPCSAFAGDLTAYLSSTSVATLRPDSREWNALPGDTIDLIAQPMFQPKPKGTTTEKLTVRSLHDNKNIAFLLEWNDSEKSEAGKLGEYSDAVAIQFPMNSKDEPPPIIMGSKEDPVHIFHWRAQYQRDEDNGKPTVKDLYPNVNVDMYPMEYSDHGKLRAIKPEEREMYNPAVALGNPQSYAKTGVDEIVAEGFMTSSVLPSRSAKSFAKWEANTWRIVVIRPLSTQAGSVLNSNKSNFAAFAIWQGGKEEVGSRKSVTMTWSPLRILKTSHANKTEAK